MHDGAPRNSLDPLVIVGNRDIIHVGAHLLEAARSVGIPVHMCDTREAFAAPRVVHHVNWRLRGHRPARLEDFSCRVVEVCREIRPRWLLSTGLAPVNREGLVAIGRMGVERINFLTDDPWNPAHRAPWFLQALVSYDHVFSPRRSNIADLRRHGCRAVEYLPFAYSPTLQFPEPPSPGEQARFASDIVFIGGADPDRLPYLSALIRAGFSLALYGTYWERNPQTRRHARGYADPSTYRKAVGGAAVALCLVRRANRDGHTMRSFEIPAIGGAMLTEDTAEHREIFGDDGRAVMFFRTVPQMVERVRLLLEDEQERRRLAQTARQLVTGGANTYADRLMTMLGAAFL